MSKLYDIIIILLNSNPIGEVPIIIANLITLNKKTLHHEQGTIFPRVIVRVDRMSVDEGGVIKRQQITAHSHVSQQ